MTPFAIQPAAPAGSCWSAIDFVIKHHDMDKDQKKHLQNRFRPRLGTGAQYGSAVRDEPVPARHRRRPLPDRVRCRFPRHRSRRPLQRGADQSTLRQEKQHRDRQRRGGPGKGRAPATSDRISGPRTKNKQLNFCPTRQDAARRSTAAARSSFPTTCCSKGGAGETVRRNLLQQCDVHTLLRLPTGIFYAQGVKANVLFFDAKPAQEKAWTKKLWVYDLRTNMHFTLKTNPLKRADLDEFVKLLQT